MIRKNIRDDCRTFALEVPPAHMACRIGVARGLRLTNAQACANAALPVREYAND